jgi:type IV secretion system protein VirB8
LTIEPTFFISITMTVNTAMNIDESGETKDPTTRLSRRTLEQLAKADAWDTDRMEQAALSIRRAWLAAGTGALIGVLGIAAAAWSHRTPPPPPMAVVVDRSTGQAQVISKVTQSDVPALAVLDQHNAAQYVRAREGYFPSLLQRDYDAVARMSTPVAFKAYGDRFVGEKALHKQLGMTQEHRIAIVSARPVRLPSPSNATTPELATGEMVVTFDKEVRSNHSPQPALSRHVATIQYEYRPSAMSKDIDRIENPFGFVVTAYRVDAELGTPAPAAATPAAAAQTAQTTGAKS